MMTMKWSRYSFCRFLFALPLASCRVLLPEATRPVRTLVFEAQNPQVDEVVILLPGRHSVPEEFVREGIVALIQAKRPRARILVPDLHLRYYMNQSASKALWEDMIQPARNQGLKVTLLGVSMGGLGALITFLEHPKDVHEVMLLAPYLGEEKLLAEIESVADFSRWDCGVETPRTKDEAMRFLWGSLQKLKNKGTQLPITLTCGKKDRHLASNRLLAEKVLATDQYQEVEGGHDWPAWRLGAEWLLR